MKKFLNLIFMCFVSFSSVEAVSRYEILKHLNRECGIEDDFEKIRGDLNEFLRGDITRENDYNIKILIDKFLSYDDDRISLEINNCCERNNKDPNEVSKCKTELTQLRSLPKYSSNSNNLQHYNALIDMYNTISSSENNTSDNQNINANGAIKDFINDYINNCDIRINTRPRGEHYIDTSINFYDNQDTFKSNLSKLTVEKQKTAEKRLSFIFESGYRKLKKSYMYNAVSECCNVTTSDENNKSKYDYQSIKDFCNKYVKTITPPTQPVKINNKKNDMDKSDTKDTMTQVTKDEDRKDTDVDEEILDRILYKFTSDAYTLGFKVGDIRVGGAYSKIPDKSIEDTAISCEVCSRFASRHQSDKYESYLRGDFGENNHILNIFSYRDAYRRNRNNPQYKECSISKYDDILKGIEKTCRDTINQLNYLSTKDAIARAKEFKQKCTSKEIRQKFIDYVHDWRRCYL